jgi:polysaccharide chain length determinant protein (PEP-CTERM system associated)
MNRSPEIPSDESSPDRPALSRLSILRAWWKRRASIIAIWIVLAACSIQLVRILPAVYMAEAVVLVDSQKIPEKFVSATVASDLDDRIAAIRQQILSSAELKRVIEEFGLYRKEQKTHFEEETLEMMRKDITITLEPVSNAKRTGAFRIGYQGPDPVLVARVANRLTDLYVEQNLRTREGQAEGTSEFLETQLREAKKVLDGLEASVSAYKLKHNGELPQQQESLGSTLSRLQVELEANRDAINRVQQTRVILESNLNGLEASLAAQIRALQPVGRPVQAGAVTDPAGTALRPRSEILQEQLDLLRVRYSDQHPDVIRLRADLERVKKAEDQERAANRGKAVRVAASDQPPVAAQEPPELARTREQITGMKAQIKATDIELKDRNAEQQRILRDTALYQSRIERLPVREQEMAQLTRDYEMSKENYKSLLDKKMAAEMALDMERRQKSERFTILDRAKAPARPVKPKRPLLYGIASTGSLALALLIGLGLELRRNVFLGEWELPEGTVVLARLPHIDVGVQPSRMKPDSKAGRSREKELAGTLLSLLCLSGPLTAMLRFLGDRL